MWQHGIGIQGHFLDDLDGDGVIGAVSDGFAHLTEATFANYILKFVHIMNIFHLLQVLEIFHVGRVRISTILKHLVLLFLIWHRVQGAHG